MLQFQLTRAGRHGQGGRGEALADAIHLDDGLRRVRAYGNPGIIGRQRIGQALPVFHALHRQGGFQRAVEIGFDAQLVFSGGDRPILQWRDARVASVDENPGPFDREIGLARLVGADVQAARQLLQGQGEGLAVLVCHHHIGCQRCIPGFDGADVIGAGAQQIIAAQLRGQPGALEIHPVGLRLDVEPQLAGREDEP